MGISCRSQIRCGSTPAPEVGLVGAAQREELLLPLALSLEQMELDCCGFLCGMCFLFLGLLAVVLLCSLAARDGFTPFMSPQHWGPAQLFPKLCPAGCRHLGTGLSWHKALCSAWVEGRGGRMSPAMGLVRMEPQNHLGWKRALESNPPPALGHQPMSPWATSVSFKTSHLLYQHIYMAQQQFLALWGIVQLIVTLFPAGSAGP